MRFYNKLRTPKADIAVSAVIVIVIIFIIVMTTVVHREVRDTCTIHLTVNDEEKILDSIEVLVKVKDSKAKTTRVVQKNMFSLKNIYGCVYFTVIIPEELLDDYREDITLHCATDNLEGWQHVIDLKVKTINTNSCNIQYGFDIIYPHTFEKGQMTTFVMGNKDSAIVTTEDSCIVVVNYGL